MVAAPFHFDRTARVTIVPATGPGIFVNPPTSVGTPLRVMFDVDRSISKDPNKAVVQILNLARSSRERAVGLVRRRVDFSREFAFIDGRLIEGAALGGSTELVETANGFAYLKIEAGYDGVAGVIFEGGTHRLSNERQGQQWVTTAEAGDGDLGLTQSIANKTFAEGTPVLSIVAYLVRIMGLTPSGLASPPPALAAATSEGVSCLGRARDCLTELLRGFRLDWFVDSGEFWILDESGVLPLPPVPWVIVYGRPKKLESNAVEVAGPLDGRVRPGGTVALASEEFAGVYKVSRVRHTGDNRSGRFQTIAELVDLSPIAGF